MVCASFFERYDVEIEETRMRTVAMEEKYKNWSKILIEPNAMNVARVYCLEARVEDEERTRLRESKFM